VIVLIPPRCPPVLTHLVPDVLDSAEDRKNCAAGAAVLGAELAGEALAVAEAPIDDQPRQLLSVDGPSPRIVTKRIRTCSEVATIFSKLVAFLAQIMVRIQG